MRRKNVLPAPHDNAFFAWYWTNPFRIHPFRRPLFWLFLLLLLVGEGLAAPRSSSSNKPSIDRRMRSVLHRFTITPQPAKVAINHTEHFIVTDSQGKPVAVRWVISGLGCEGADCGTIDDNGIYHPPATLPSLQVVTLEGIVISDPSYSVLTEIHLQKAIEPDAIAASPNRENLAARINLPSRAVISPVPIIERSLRLSPPDISIPRAVGVAPVVVVQNLGLSKKNLPLPSVITATPTIERIPVSRGPDLPVMQPAGAPPFLGVLKSATSNAAPLPLTTVVAATPTIDRQPAGHAALFPLLHAVQPMPSSVSMTGIDTATLPLLSAIDAPPSMQQEFRRSRGANFVLQRPVEATPALATGALLANGTVLPLPSVIAAPSLIERASSQHKNNLPLPHAIEAAPTLVGSRSPASASTLPLPSVIVSAPAIQSVSASLVVRAPSPGVIGPPPGVVNPLRAANTTILPLPSVINAAPTIEHASRSHSPGLALPLPVQAIPGVAMQKSIAVTAWSLPTAIESAPTIMKTLSLHSDISQLQKPVAPAPAVATQACDNKSLPALPSAVAAAPTVELSPAASVSLQTALVQPRRPLFEHSLVNKDNPNGTNTLQTPDPSKPSTRTVSSVNTQVEYRDGLLTINTQNTTLAEVLKQVAEKTGATIEAPPSAGLEHIVEHYGPAPAKEVLAHLLYGSSFNFVLVSSSQNSQDLATILLSERSESANTPPPTPAPNVLTASKSWTPPDDTTTLAVLPAHLDEGLEVPKDKMSPEALSDFMKQKFQELRQKAQQQYPQ